MELIKFKEELQDREGIQLNEDYIIFNDFELFSTKTNQSIKFKKFEDLLKGQVEGKTIEEIINEIKTLETEDNGGRGSSSSSGTGGSLFGSQRGGRKTTFPSGGNMPSAYANTLTSARYRTPESIAKAFGKQMLNAYREYSMAVDENGFATKYNKGAKGSTAHLVQEGGYSIHNHPTKDKSGKTIAWNIYSKADLQNSALDKGRGTIVVSNGNRTMYKFEKTKGFKAKEFVKGLNSAKSNESNYDKAVDSWLKKNQKTYGYKYTKSKF